MREGWTYKRLEEVATIKSGYTPSSDDLSDVGVVPYFKVGDMNMVGNEKYLQYSLSFVDDTFKTFPHNSIAFPKNGAAIATNKKRILKQSSVVDLNTAVLIPIKNENVEYLYYWICKIDFREITRRGAVPTLDIKTLMQLEVPYPPLSEQQRIVSELDLLSSIIEKKKAQLKEYDQLAQSIFYDMFGDPITNEKGWEVKKLGEVYKLKSGDGLSAKQFVDGQYPVYGGNGISGYHKAYNMDGNYIIVGRVGAYCGNVRNVIGKFWLTDNAFQLIYDIEQQHPVFVKYVLTYLDLHQYANHAAQPVISNTTLKDIKVVFPPLSLQQSFAEKIEAIEKQKSLVQQSIVETQTMFDYTMDKYFG